MSEKPYQLLEHQIARIHELLDRLDAEVTWNDHLPDPDDPDQMRQIDVSIRRNNRLTVVECRAHKAPQDVQWVEHLAGRRLSLNADSIIGVSSSGFTDLATVKARRLGVILRDFRSLSAEEISEWGKLSTLTLIFYEFRDVEMAISVVNLSDASEPKITSAPPRSILMPIAEQLKIGFEQNDFRSFHVRVDGASVQVDGAKPQSVEVKGRVRSRRYQTEQPSVAIYCGVGQSDPTIEAQVEQFDIGQSQVIKGSQLSSIVFDLSKVKIPDRCVCAVPLISSPNGIRVSHVDVIGTDSWLQSKVTIKYVIRSKSAFRK